MLFCNLKIECIYFYIELKLLTWKINYNIYNLKFKSSKIKIKKDKKNVIKTCMYIICIPFYKKNCSACSSMTYCTFPHSLYENEKFTINEIIIF